MVRKVFSFLLLGAIIILPAVAQASIEISEIMYDVPGTDTDREWIEVQNTGDSAVDLSTYKLFEANTNHGLTISQGSATIPAGWFAIIADKPSAFLSDNAGYTGAIFDSSFSLSNTGESLSIKDGAGNITDTVTYDPTIGAGGDGNSLQKVGSVWKAGVPTPGAQFQDNSSSTTNQSNNPQTNTNTQNEIVSTHYVSNDISIEPVGDSETTLTASAGRNRLVAIGSPIQFHASVGGSAPKNGAEYKWSLGDGFIAYGEAVEHMYSFAGDYVVVLTVSNGPKVAVHRINVKVINPDLSAKHIDGGIEIKNNGKDEVNLFKWLVSSGDSSYNIPADLIVLPAKSVVLDALISKLPDGGDITITNAEGKNIILAPYKESNLISSKPKTTANNDVQIQNSDGTNSNTAAVADTLVIEHNKGFFNRIGEFLKRLFSSP